MSMRNIQIRSLPLAALALLAFAGSATTQDKPPALLNALEVRQLVGRAEPGDHARIGAHFAALAERYTTEATRHTSMSKDSVGNPSRNLTTGLRTHCERLAKLNAESAAALRELVVHHERLAAGAPSPVPTSGARFEEGVGAPAPTDRDLTALAESARTSGDHRALETYFLTLAKRYTADANEHVGLARAYRGTRFGSEAVHCDRLAALSRDAAKEATSAAAMHKALAERTK